MHINGRIAAAQLGHFLQAARMRKGWRLEDTALQLKGHNVSKNLLSRLERGLVKFRDQPTMAKVEAVCKLLKVTIPFEQAPKPIVELQRLPEPEPTAPPTEVAPAKPTADLEVSVLASATNALNRIDDGAARGRIVGYLMERFVNSEARQ